MAEKKKAGKSNRSKPRPKAKSKPKPRAKAPAKRSSRTMAKSPPGSRSLAKRKSSPKPKRSPQLKPKNVALPDADVVAVEVVETVIKGSEEDAVITETAIVIDQAAIARRAYEIWERKGRPADDGSQNWAQAEAELRAARRQG